MKIYIVTVSRYYYWKDSCSSGHIAKKYYFTDKTHADNFLTNEQQNPYWIDAKGNPAPVEKPYHKPYFEMETVETED